MDVQLRGCCDNQAVGLGVCLQWLFCGHTLCVGWLSYVSAAYCACRVGACCSVSVCRVVASLLSCCL